MITWRACLCQASENSCYLTCSYILDGLEFVLISFSQSHTRYRVRISCLAMSRCSFPSVLLLSHMEITILHMVHHSCTIHQKRLNRYSMSMDHWPVINLRSRSSLLYSVRLHCTVLDNSLELAKQISQVRPQLPNFPKIGIQVLWEDWPAVASLPLTQCHMSLETN